MKTASIIIPTFNRSHLVHRAVESAIAQTYPCEVILCDHGSSDDTPKVAWRYKDRIRYIRREEDKGPIVCWRDGIKQATGDVVHITYDDDWIDRTFMQKTIMMLDNNVGFVYSNAIVHSGDKASTIFKHPAGVQPMKDFVRYLLQLPLTISPGCAIFRRKDALKNLMLQIPNAGGIYGKDSGVGEDLMLFLLTSLDYPKYAHVAEPLAHFLAHPASITINAGLSGRKNNLQEAYSNAKAYYFSRPRSLSAPSRLQRLLLNIRWNYKAGTIVEKTLHMTRRKLLNTLRRAGCRRDSA